MGSRRSGIAARLPLPALVVFVAVAACGSASTQPPVVIGRNEASTVGVARCQALGGRCGAVSDCARGGGLLGPPSVQCRTGAPFMACCLPTTACGGAHEFECCSGGARFRPYCDGGGELRCLDGQTRCKEP
jgi:hypothetical protein